MGKTDFNRLTRALLSIFMLSGSVSQAQTPPTKEVSACSEDLPFHWNGVAYSIPGTYLYESHPGSVQVLKLTVVQAAIWFPDVDGDGFGNGNLPTRLCEAQAGYVTNGTDCNDTDASTYATKPWFRDEDNDGFGAGSPLWFCMPIVVNGFSELGTDCDDQDVARNPNAADGCESYGLDPAVPAFALFPNPGSGRFYFQRFGFTDEVKLHIFNAKGALVWNGIVASAADSPTELDLHNQAPGLYWARCTAQGKNQTIRLVIQ